MLLKAKLCTPLSSQLYKSKIVFLQDAFLQSCYLCTYSSQITKLCHQAKASLFAACIAPKPQSKINKHPLTLKGAVLIIVKLVTHTPWSAITRIAKCFYFHSLIYMPGCWRKSRSHEILYTWNIFVWNTLHHRGFVVIVIQFLHWHLYWLSLIC